MILDLSIGELAEYIEEYNNQLLVDNKEIFINDYGISIQTPNGMSEINWFVKKCNLPMVNIQFDNGYSVKVAKKHIFRQNNIDVFAQDLIIGDFLDHRCGTVQIVNILDIHNDDCYDITVKEPHLYYDANGLLHHNTIITATLCKICEKYGRTLTIVPNKGLVEQTEEDFLNCKMDVGVYYGDRKELNRTHTICTWQSLNILDKKSFDNSILTLAEFLDGVSAIIIDECFHGDTLITTPSGKIPIKDLKTGDKIINLCEKTKKYKEDIVVKVHKNLTNTHNQKMLELEFDNGSKIQVTSNHKFLTNKGWVQANDLTADLEIVDVNTFN